MKIDIFSHIMPEPYLKKTIELNPRAADMDQRVRAAGALSNLEERFRAMDEFGDYAQVITLVAPAVESYGSAARDLAQLANDSMAELVARYPDRFLGFAASLPHE